MNALKDSKSFSDRLRNVGTVLEIDTRLLSLVAALLIIWMFFQITSDGLFLSPRNLWNLSVQASVTALIATGMVLIIVSRNIDLSVGSLLAFLGILGGFVQTELLPLEGPHSWWIAIVVMLMAGIVFGGLQGWIIARFAIPAFVVTLAGLMFWRGAGWLFTRGRTVTPLDSTYSIFGGGSIGEMWSWIVGAVGFALVTFSTFSRRRARMALDFPVKPLGLEIALIAFWGVVIALFVNTMNSYDFPRSDDGRGIPAPVLILIVVVAVMSYIATRSRFGRHIYGYGGNPEAAELAGVSTIKITVATFALIGALTAIGAVISTARLNAAPLSIGNLLELQVIAAAIIGGTSLAGGSGTIIGALIGALLMQSLQNGMVLLGVESSPQQMIIAGVLIFAVWLDVIYQRQRQ